MMRSSQVRQGAFLLFSSENKPFHPGTAVREISFKSRRNLMYVLVAIATFAFLACPSRAAEQPSQPPLKIVGETTLVLDPACNACKGAKLPMFLQNDGARPVHLALRVGHLVSDPGGDAANAKMGVEPAEGKNSLPAEVNPQVSVPFVVTVRGVLGKGKWKAEVYNGETHLGTASFIVPDVPLNLKLDTADPNQPAITVTRGEKSTLLLRNDDSVGYGVEWEFRLGSQPPVHKKKEKIPAGGTVALALEPKEEWFEEAHVAPCPGFTAWTEYLRVPCNFRAIFKDDQAEGLLTVRLHSDDCAEDPGAPTKLFRVKTTLAYYGASRKAFWSYLTVIILLVLGALCSLYVNYKFPDEQVRSGLNQQLRDIESSIDSLSMQLASRLRVVVGVQRRVLTERLKALSWYHTDFETLRSEIADSTSRLKRRVDQLERMGRLREDYQRLMTLELPPTILDRLEDLFEQTVKLLGVIQPADADLQDADLKLAEIRKTLLGWSQPDVAPQPDVALAAQIAASLHSLYSDLQPPAGQLAKSKTLASLRRQLMSLANELATAPPDPAQIPANEYYRRDCLAFRGAVLRDYVLLCDARNPAPRSPLIARRPELILKLKAESWNELRRARRLVKEMSEEIYADDIKKEIEAKQIEIRIDRNQIRAFEPAWFDLKFHIQKFDSAAAREEWSCTWNFGHGPLHGKKDDPKNYLEEGGWSVAHYFPEADRYTLTVRFRHEETGDLKDSTGKFVTATDDVFVGPVGELFEVTGRAAWIRKRWLELRRWAVANGNAIARLALALVPAILGLVAGAKDQILKMDLFPALSAVFLAGFGSDQVKNLLSQKPKT